MDRPFQSIPFQSLAVVVCAALCCAPPMHGQADSAPPVSARVGPRGTPFGLQQDQSQITTIRTYSNLVVVDVVVNDSQGNPVHGLKASDFTLNENNKSQSIRHFEEHSEVPMSDIQIAPAPKLPPGLFTNKSAAPVNGPVNVLLLDYLNTPLSAQPNARKQLMDYLDKAPTGTRIAIFGLTTKLDMLQGFTTDMGALKAALGGKKGAPQASDILTDPLNGGISNTELNAVVDTPPAVEGMITQTMIDDVNRFEAMQTSFQQEMREQYTLGAFDTLARYLVGIPGRKNVIWFSGGFPLDVEPNVNEQDPNDSVVRNDEDVRKMDNLLTRAQVAVYPVDARGVQIDPSQNFSSGQTPGASMDFLNEQAQEHETMFAMAEDTGGEAFVNTNNLTQAMSKAIQNGSNYYTLTYSPSNTEWDSRFRAIKIKVDQPNVKLTYRNGYFAVDPNDRNKLNAQGAATSLVQPTTMATAMIHGGPDPAEILFKVRIRPAGTGRQEEPLKTNQTNPDPKVKVEGPYQSYGVDLVPDPHAVSCRADLNGNRHCAIEVWTFVYNTDGQKLITASNRLHTMLTPADYAKLLTGGMAFHQEVSVPVKGQYFVRTAIHDMISDRVGAVEIPIAAVARLEPLKPLPAVDAPSVALPPDAPAAAAPVVVAPAPAATTSPTGAEPK